MKPTELEARTILYVDFFFNECMNEYIRMVGGPSVDLKGTYILNYFLV